MKMNSFFKVTFVASLAAFALVACDSGSSSGSDAGNYAGGTGGTSSASGLSGLLTDSRDGQVYKTVTLGTQTWMAQNLNYNPGDVSGMGTYAWSGCYDDAASNCATYGRLYTWEVAMNRAACAYGKTCNPSGVTQGLCPTGWHLPTHAEYGTLYTAIGGTGIAGTKLKSTSGWSNSGNGTDNYEFSVLPAGYRYDIGDFVSQGHDADLWSASENNRYYAWDENFGYSYVNVSRNIIYHKDYAFSVRCLKD